MYKVGDKVIIKNNAEYLNYLFSKFNITNNIVTIRKVKMDTYGILIGNYAVWINDENIVDYAPEYYLQQIKEEL